MNSKVKKAGLPALAAAALLLAGCTAAGQAEKSSSQGLEAYRSGDYARAGQLFAQAITQDKENSSYYVNLGMSELALGEYEDALASFSQACELGGSRFYALRGRGLACMGLGNYEDACKAFDEALAEKEASSAALKRDILCYRAEAYAGNREWEAALSDYKTLAESGYRTKDLYLLMGDTYAQAGDFENALAFYQKSLDIDGADYRSLLHMAGTLDRAGAESERETVLNAALQITPKSAEELCGKGQCLLELSLEQEAFAAFEESYHNGCRKAGLFLGYCYELRGNTEEAERLYMDLISEAPEDPACYNALGECCIRNEKYEDALTVIDKGILLAKNGSDKTEQKNLSWNRCICLERMGKREETLSALLDFVRTYPEDERAQRELVFLQSRK